MKVDELRQEVDRFLSKQALEEQETRANDFYQRLAEKELLETDGQVLHTDHNNYTPVMSSEIVAPYRDRLIKWKNNADSYVSNILEISRENSAQQAQEDLSKLKRKHEEDRELAQETFTRENDYVDTKKQKVHAEERYSRMLQENGGKPPGGMNLVWMALGIMIVLAVEAGINFSTFDSKYGAPGLAAGMTAVVALIFAVASHFHGGFLKQRVALMGRDVQKHVRNHSITVQVVVTVFFMIALAGLMIVRYQVIQDETSVMSGLPTVSLPGAEVEPVQTVWQLLLPTLLFNLGAWGLGVFVAYFAHDARPDYREAMKTYEKAKRTFNSLESKLEEEYVQIDADFKKRSEELKARIAAQEKVRKQCDELNIKINLELDKIIKASIIRINDGVRHYRGVLVSIAKSTGKSDMSVGPQALTLDGYLQNDIFMSPERLEEMA